LRKRVVIIGGGFSGLAAGVALAESGFEALLLERRNHLGGRAYSFTDARTGDTVDNGQHLFMGCYLNTISFLEKIGCLDKLKFQAAPTIDFLDSSRTITTLRCPALPAPMHVLAGLFKMKGLALKEKIRALSVGRALRSNQRNPVHAEPEPLTVAEWLDRLKQSENIKRRFWYPMALATLNESPEVASAFMMRRVLQEAFCGSVSDSAIGIAAVGLSDLYTSGAQRFIESRGGRVRTGAQAVRLVVEKQRAAAVELKDGERIEADFFISAAPQHALLELLPEGLRATEFAPLAMLALSPIVSINLWLDRPITDREFVGLLGTKLQWLFNKDRIYSSRQQTNQIALVISAARDFIDWTKAELVEMAMAELSDLLPESRSARLLHAVIVKEREATIAHTVASDRLRQGPRTSIANLFLAGDWTATGLPATIESAVLSGHTAARLIELESA
jgi:squalene-associated FAD-dependent desaturase